MPLHSKADVRLHNACKIRHNKLSCSAMLSMLKHPPVSGTQVGQKVRAARKDAEIPMNPFTAGVYVATMMATVYVLKQKVLSCALPIGLRNSGWATCTDVTSCQICCTEAAPKGEAVR